MKQLLFLCISLAILLFAVIVTNVAPIIKGRVGGNWPYYSCKIYSDYYDLAKKDNDYDDSKAKDKYLDKIKKEKTRCDRRKAMNGLEYVVSNLNIIFGFVCAFTGFLLYQNIGNLGSDGKYIGLIGLGCGVVGFVLTLVYVIESGLVFTDVDGEIYDFFKEDDHYYSPYYIRIDSDGAFLEWDSGKKRYTCIFYKEDKEDSLYRRFSDYGNKYLNYYKDIKINDNSDKYNKYNGCTLNLGSYDLYELCYALSKETDQEIEGRNNPYPNDYVDDVLKSLIKNIKPYNKDQNDHSKTGDCEKIYYGSYYTDNIEYKVTYDYWLTSLIFSCLIMVLYIGLALFGFLLFKDGGSSSSSGPVSIK